MQPTQRPSTSDTETPSWRTVDPDERTERQLNLLAVIAEAAPNSTDPQVWERWCDRKRIAGYLLYMDNIGTQLGDDAIGWSVQWERNASKWRELH
jgi:hypothetical protein